MRKVASYVLSFIFAVLLALVMLMLYLLDITEKDP